MKILYYTFSIPSSRHNHSGVFNLNRISSLAKKHMVTVFVPTSIVPSIRYLFPIIRPKELVKDIKNKIHSRIFKIEGIKIIQCKWLKLPKAYFWKINIFLQYSFVKRKLLHYFKLYEPEIIIVSGMDTDLAAIIYFIEKNKIINVKVFAIPEGSDILIRANKNKKQYFTQLVEKNKIQIIAVSDNMYEYIRKTMNPDKIYKINNGFNNKIFNVISNPSLNNEHTFISVGRLEIVKGYDFLINALSKIQSNYKCYIIGEGTQKSILYKLIQQNNLDKKIILLGSKNQIEILSYFKNCDLFIIPSRSESFGISALEANACGIPVLASNVGGLNNLIKDGFNGYKFESVNSESFIHAYNNCILKNWNRREIMDYTHNNFSWDKWCLEIEKLF
jgi:teichuronic acid biosynthesis glycosyltransferase TuaC